MDPQQQPQHPGFMPVPWWHPGMMQQQGFMVENVVPARVRLAAEFSLMMARRACPIVAVDNLGNIQSEPAPAVTNPEQDAWDSACKLLTDYFGADVAMDDWEDQRHEATKTEVDRRRIGRVADCMACGGKNAECALCDGSGQVLIMPARSK